MGASSLLPPASSLQPDLIHQPEAHRINPTQGLVDRVKKSLLVLALLLLAQVPLAAQTMATVAGNIAATDGLRARDTVLVSSRAVAAGANGVIYIADDGSRTVRRIDPATLIASVIAGGGTVVDDLVPVPARSAYLNLPASLAVGPGATLFIADDVNHRIRRVDATGNITTVAGNGRPGFSGDGGPANWARLDTPTGVAADSAGNLYISDLGNNAIRRVDAATGLIRTIAGGPTAKGVGDNIPATTAALNFPAGIDVDNQGNAYFCDLAGHVVRRIEASSGLIRTVAGNGTADITGDGGPARSAALLYPSGVAVAGNGDLYISHLGRVRKVLAATGVISSLLGGGINTIDDGLVGTEVALPSVLGQVSLASASTLLVALPEDHMVLKLDLVSGAITRVAGNPAQVGDGGAASAAAVAAPSKLALDAAGNLYVADTSHHRVRRIAPGAGGVGTGTITTVAGTGQIGYGTPDGAAATATAIFRPQGLEVDSAGNLYFTDGGRCVRKVGSDGLVRTVVGSPTALLGFAGDGGAATAARLSSPQALLADTAGNLYIADTGNHRVRKVDATGIRTIAGIGPPGYSGDGGAATAAQLNYPYDLLLDPNGNLLIADAGNGRIRRLDLSTGVITTWAGNGSDDQSGDGGAAKAAGLLAPGGLAADSAGNVYLTGLHSVRRIEAGTRIISTLAGGEQPGFLGDNGAAALARLRDPQGIIADAAGNIIFADMSNNRLRRISAVLLVPELAISGDTLAFTVAQGDDAPPPQWVRVVTRNLVNAPWSASITSIDGGGGWLSLSPAAGVTPDVMQIAVDTFRLRAGAYNAAVTVSSLGAAKSPQTIRVTLTVTAPVPRLAVDHDFLTFRATAGGASPATQTVEVKYPAAWSSAAKTSNSANWLSVSPAGGDRSATLTVKVTLGSLQPGVYQGLIVLTGGADVAPISVAFIVSPPVSSLMLSHLGALFTVNQGASYAPSDDIQVVNAGDGNMAWEAQVVSLASSDWLEVSPQSGTAAAGSAGSLTVTPRPGGLAAGVYNALVTVTAKGAQNSPQLLLARLIVQKAGTASAGSVRPGGLAFIAAAGGSALRGSLSIYATGGTLSFAAAASSSVAGWLSVSPTAGSLQGSADGGKLTVQADPSGLASGAYRGRITLSFSNDVTQDIGVLLIVTPGVSASAVGPLSAGSHSAACTPAQQFPLHTVLVNSFNLPSGWAAPILVRVLDNCGNTVSNSAVAVTFTNGDDALVLRPIGNGTYSGLWSLGRSGPTTIGVLATGSGLQAGRADPISGVVGTPGVGAPGTPLIYHNGAVHGASFARYAPLAPGQIFSLFGSNLASDKTDAASIPLPNSLGGLSATLGGIGLPLYYADGGQVNAQVPFDLSPGNTLPLVVKSAGSASPPELVTLADVQPGIFTLNSSGSGAGVVTDAAGGLIGDSNPARAGQVVIVYATGLGATDQAVRTGQASPAHPPAAAVSPVTAYVGGLQATVEFAGLTPGLVGLYQVNVRLPNTAQPGSAVELYLEQNQVASNKVTITIR